MDGSTPFRSHRAAVAQRQSQREPIVKFGKVMTRLATTPSCTPDDMAVGLLRTVMVASGTQSSSTGSGHGGSSAEHKQIRKNSAASYQQLLDRVVHRRMPAPAVAGRRPGMGDDLGQLVGQQTIIRPWVTRKSRRVSLKVRTGLQLMLSRWGLRQALRKRGNNGLYMPGSGDQRPWIVVAPTLLWGAL